MASLNSPVVLTNEPTEKTERKLSPVSSENLPQIKVECSRGDMDRDNTSTFTDETNTGTDNASTEPDDASTGPDDASTGPDDASTGTDDTSSGEDSSVYAPEGGWGWLVTLAGFLVAFIVDGIVSSFGLLIPELLTTYGASMSLTSLPPAILVGIYQISGPVTAYLVKRWGCRLVGFCGGLVAAVGVAGSAYAPNIYVFILCFGVVAGVGVGLIYLPSVTMVNMYFHKKRGIVAGIITSGSGFGLLALAPLTEMLMEQYGWRGCYLIVAAITLHFCVCASLMRPLPHPPPSSTYASHSLERVVVVERSCPFSQGEDGLSLVNVQELEDTSESDHLTKSSFLVEDGQDAERSHTNTSEENEHGPHLHRRTLREESSQHGSLLSSVKNLFLSHHVMGGSHVPLSSDGPAGFKQGLLTRSRSHGHLGSSSTHRSHARLPVNALSTWLACQVPPSLSRHTLHSHQSSDSMARQHAGAENQKGSELSGTHVTPSVKKGQEVDITWGQSLPSVPLADDIFKHVLLKNQIKMNGHPLVSAKASAEESHKEPAAGYSLIPHDALSSADSASPQLTEKRSVMRWMRQNRAFVLFLIGAFLIQLVCTVPPLLTPSYAYQYGVSKEEVATILAIYGLLNTAGRLLAGVLVYWGVRTLHVYNLGTLLSAVACFIFPSCTSFPSLAVCLGLHGFFLGAFPPLQSVILVEYLGLERLTSTFGIMCMVKAFASAAGAPLAGELVTVTGTYTVPVAVCGAVLVKAAVIHQVMDC